MSQQASNEFYKDDEELAMAFAEARQRRSAGPCRGPAADVIQLDETLGTQQSGTWQKRYAVEGDQPAALQGITVPTVVHLCFGYRPPWCRARPSPPAIRSWLKLGDTKADQISIEAAQPETRSRRAGGTCRRRRSCWACSISAIPRSKPPEIVADRIRHGLKYVAAEAAHSGAGLRHEIHAAPDRLRQAQGHVRRPPRTVRKEIS